MSSGRASPGLLLSARWYFKQMDNRYDDFFERLLVDVIRPIDTALYGPAAELAYHHDYCICYEPEADRVLKPHTDDSDLTVNIFLGAGAGRSVHEGADLLLLSPTDEDTRCGTPRHNAHDYQGGSARYTHTRRLAEPSCTPATDGTPWSR
mmetsp:Transcript_3052/g.10376  ORF Transcript_3052/g.10376 Transcript_3052/m.10376 type:complete len:150 (-) Transcript_3052:856-1305(-)